MTKAKPREKKDDGNIGPAHAVKMMPVSDLIWARFYLNFRVYSCFFLRNNLFFHIGISTRTIVR